MVEKRQQISKGVCSSVIAACFWANLQFDLTPCIQKDDCVFMSHHSPSASEMIQGRLTCRRIGGEGCI